MSEVWQISSLGKHCYIKARIGWRGLSASEYTEDGPYLIAGKHVDNGVINWEKCDHITNFRYRESWEIALKEGDVILTKDGTIGRVARIDKLPGEATINGTMMLLRPQAILDYRFLYHVLNGQRFKRLVEDKVSGSSIPHIFQRDMVTLSVSFPPLDHQKQIAQILDTLDTTIRQTEAIIAKLQQVKQGLLHDLLTRGIDANGQLRPPVEQAPHLYKESPLGWIPREWEVEKISKACSLIRDGTHLPPARISEGPLLLSVRNMKDGNFVLTEQDTHISESFYNQMHKHWVIEKGDVLLAIVGATIGKIAIVCDMPKFTLQRSVAILRGKQEVLVNQFLFSYFGYPEFQISLWRQVNQTAQPGIYLDQLGSICIRLPSVREQIEITDRLQAVEIKITQEYLALEKLKKKKSALMDDLLTGRVRVTALISGGIPASKELERKSA